jgi:thiaminase/transcriptional activator TenA
MPFSDHLRNLAKPIWDAQLTHPFVVALGKGTLPERKFKYYILQDARFLGDLARVFSAGALKAPDSASALRLTKLAEETIVVERSLHEGYGARWKMSAKQMTAVPMAPTNFAYTSTCWRSRIQVLPQRSRSSHSLAPGSTVLSGSISSEKARRPRITPTATG